MDKRIGYYCWAGPGTERMINLKYFSPRMDLKSIYGSYELDYLSKVRDTLSVTDFWATYSWGFSDKTEQVDHEFLLTRLSNFKDLEIKVHAYLQGTNLVRSEFTQDYWARDLYGREIPYFRGRRITCPNNPEFREYWLGKVGSMVNLGFDGIYIDNIQMGNLGLPLGSSYPPILFAGCACKYCQEKFDGDISEATSNGEVYREYLRFRNRSILDLLESASEIVRTAGLEFGSNFYDPKFDARYVYGIDYSQLEEIQDYILFETHSFPEGGVRGKSSLQINEYANTVDKPVFSLEYKKRIGAESQLRQEDLDSLYSEAEKSNFNLMLKGSEFITDGVWHNLRFEGLTSPSRVGAISDYPAKKDLIREVPHGGKGYLGRFVGGILDFIYTYLTWVVMELRMFRWLMSFAYKYIIR